MPEIYLWSMLRSDVQEMQRVIERPFFDVFVDVLCSMYYIRPLHAHDVSTCILNF